MINLKDRSIFLGIAVAIIMGAIWFIQINKPVTIHGTPIAVTPLQNTTPTIITPKTTQSPVDRSSIIKHKAATYPSAVEIIPGGQFINSDPFTLKSLIGKKVILIDFWTYTCINCQRTTPHLNTWYEKYKDQGFVIIGIHSPEFEFEKDYNNVKKATQDLGIQYPVVQDNDYATWSAYGNRYWPHKYLIDIDGYIVYDHIGEGGYDQTEKEIQKALEERIAALKLNESISKDVANPKDQITTNSLMVQSPEMYFGTSRLRNLASSQYFSITTKNYQLPENINLNEFSLGGNWRFFSEYAKLTEGSGQVNLKFHAAKLYMVASSEKPVTLVITVDGKLQTPVIVQESKLYTLFDSEDYADHVIEMRIDQAGFEAFTFTFG